MTITTFEHFSVELFDEIFIYLQFHEIFNSFSNLNSRFTAILNNMPLMRIYLGQYEMSIAVTEFYYKYLSQSNACNRLFSLCVSDKLAFSNGLWLAEHLFTFNNLHCLSLIDIKRSTFESILNAFSSNTSLIMFSLKFSTYSGVIQTYEGVPEGAYYERIFRLFPLLRICHLRFRRYVSGTLDSDIALPLNQTFIPVQTRLLNLQSIAFRDCSLDFLKHLLEQHPQVQELSFSLSKPWLPNGHPLLNDDKNRISRIDKRLVPNLRCLKIKSRGDTPMMELLDGLFEHDVLFSLTNFTLIGIVTGSNVLHNLLSMLYHQCLYVLDVKWFVRSPISSSDVSDLLLDTFRQLKGSIRIELEILLGSNGSYVRALTVPKIDKSLDAFSYSEKNTVQAQSYWPSTVQVSNNHSRRINKIYMSGDHSQIPDEFRSCLSTICSLRQITSVEILNASALWRLDLLFSELVKVRSLRLLYYSTFTVDEDGNKQQLMDFLNDTSLCTTLMSNSLQKLELYAHWEYVDMMVIAPLIVKRFPHLQIIDFNCDDSQISEALLIFMNGLPKLTFVKFHVTWSDTDEQHSKLCNVLKYSTRTYQMEYRKLSFGDIILYVWL